MKLYPFRLNSNSLTENKVDPIPVAPELPTSTVIRAPIPVSVVAPVPTLDTPTIGISSYDGLGVNSFGSLYPVPAWGILNDKAPPTPISAVIVAPEPTFLPTNAVIESVLNDIIDVSIPDTGSVFLGYGWFVE